MSNRWMLFSFLVSLVATQLGCVDTSRPWYEQASKYPEYEEPPGITELADGRVQIREDFAYSKSASLESLVEAYEILLNTHEFAPGQVGFAPMPSKQGLAFNLILRQPDALQAFELLMEQGHPAGQLYGVCGLYFLAPDRFQEQVATLRNSTDTTDFMVADTGGPMAVRSLVYDSAAIQLERGQTIKQYWKTSGAELARADIAGGWYCQELVEENDPERWQHRLDSLIQKYKPE